MSPSLQLIRMAEQMKDDVQASEQQVEQQSLMARYNMKVVKDYLKNARVSVIALGVIWVVYIFECIYTWVTFSTIFGLGTVPAITLLKLGGNVALLVKFGQVYRLFTAILLHAGILHIFMNSASLIAFCAGVEATVSFPLYITVFIVGGLQGNMLSDLYNLHIGTSTTVGVGSSTSICAVMGLFMAKLYIDSKKSGRGVELAKKRIIVMLVYIVIISLLPSVDFFGHIGSLISGGLIGLTVLPCGEAEVKQLSWLGIAGIVIYSLMLFSIFA